VNNYYKKGIIILWRVY